MIDDIIKRRECCGCKACGDICPQKAISYSFDKNGFWFPIVDSQKCIKCGLCIKTCPTQSVRDFKRSPICYGAWSKNQSIRENSTSGGIFTELATEWLKDGGITCGAAYESNLVVKHKIINKVDELSSLRNSKYVQSDMESIYISIKKELDKEQNVLFCGTPCQVVALKNFLKIEYNNLFTIDFICCGVPSPLAYKKYIAFLEGKYHSKIKSIWFKNKKLGWHNLGTLVDFENHKQYFRTGNRDLYMVAYIDDGLTIRESCTNCRYRSVPHASDITLGDFWGIEDTYPQYNDDKGTSAVIINSPLGLEMFSSIKDKIECFNSNINDIAYGNFTLYKSKKGNPNQSDFFEALNTCDFKYAMNKFSTYKGLKKIRISIKLHIRQIYRKTVKK